MRTWRVEPGETSEAIRASFDDEVARSREVVSACTVARRHAPADPRANDRSLRWIMLHMIEEYARHLGHADIMREAIDGHTGD